MQPDIHHSTNSIDETVDAIEGLPPEPPPNWIKAFRNTIKKSSHFTLDWFVRGYQSRYRPVRDKTDQIIESAITHIEDDITDEENAYNSAADAYAIAKDYLGRLLEDHPPTYGKAKKYTFRLNIHSSNGSRTEVLRTSKISFEVDESGNLESEHASSDDDAEAKNPITSVNELLNTTVKTLSSMQHILNTANARSMDALSKQYDLQAKSMDAQQKYIQAVQSTVDEHVKLHTEMCIAQTESKIVDYENERASRNHEAVLAMVEKASGLLVDMYSNNNNNNNNNNIGSNNSSDGGDGNNNNDTNYRTELKTSMTDEQKQQLIHAIDHHTISSFMNALELPTDIEAARAINEIKKSLSKDKEVQLTMAIIEILTSPQITSLKNLARTIR